MVKSEKKQTKPVASRIFNPELKIGEGEALQEAIIQCDSCDVVFKVQLEPEYTDPELAKQFGGKPRRVLYCPFCGDEELSERG